MLPIPIEPSIIAAAKALGLAVSKKFASSVIERWTRERARQFFESYSEAVSIALSGEGKWGDANALADEMMEDETRSEVLFDAYRRVCFAKSRIMGPRILGSLTATLTLEGRMATDDEERVFAAAERLSDPDLVNFFKFFEEQKAAAASENEKVTLAHGEIHVHWVEESQDSNASNNRIDIGPLDFTEALGGWAKRAEEGGLLSHRIINRTEEYRIRDERWDGDGTLTIYTVFIVIKSPSFLLADHIRYAPAKAEV